MSETPLTPLEKAPAWYRELRRKWRRLGAEERQRYFFARIHRDYVKRWNSRDRENLIERRQQSVEETRTYVARWTEFLDWMEQYVKPSEERFAQVRGRSVDGTTTSDQGGNSASVKNRSVYDGDVRAYAFFTGRMRSRLDDVSDELDLAEDMSDGQTLLDNLIDEVHAAGMELGLDPHPQWVDGHDGAVWFVDQETGNTYFVLLSLFVEFCDVVYSLEARRSPDPRWVNHGLVDLTRTALDITKPAPRIDLSRYFRDYFGYFNSSLRPYLRAADQEPPFDWE